MSKNTQSRTWRTDGARRVKVTLSIKKSAVKKAKKRKANISQEVEEFLERKNEEGGE